MPRRSGRGWGEELLTVAHTTTNPIRAVGWEQSGDRCRRENDGAGGLHHSDIVRVEIPQPSLCDAACGHEPNNAQTKSAMRLPFRWRR